MKLSEFDYALPKELIAQYPLVERENARLMVVDRQTCAITHAVFKDIGQFLDRHDVLVLNDTKVMPCRIPARRPTQGKVEILLLGKKEGGTFRALTKPARLKINETLYINDNGMRCTLTGKNEVTFDTAEVAKIYSQGVMPLPPYIKRKPQDIDKQYYQTVYASKEGSVAAPTAGLHFTSQLLSSLQEKGVLLSWVTLHVGYATFKPVKAEDIENHLMEEEYFSVPQATLQMISKTSASEGRVIAVGTTSCRALESFAKGNLGGKTNLFIYPGYNFKIVSGLLTNFHLPRSTLLMLVGAFAGMPLMKKAYQEAIDKKYRFYSYGDCMLIL